jgi:hypothetical protein
MQSDPANWDGTKPNAQRAPTSTATSSMRRWAARYFDHWDEEIAHMDVAVSRLLDGCVE